VIDFVADRPKDYAPYGLDKPRAELTVKTAAGAGRGEQTFALHFGKRTGEGARCYVRLPSEPNVYEVQAELLNRIENGALEFRDRQILALKPGRMTAIDLRNHRATYEAQRGPSAGVWLLNSPILAVGDRVAFAELVILMTELRAKRLVAEKGLANPIYGLNPKAGEPYQKVVLTLAKAAGEPAEATLLVGSPCGDEGDRYAAMLDSGLVFVMAGEDVKKLDAEFLSPVVINHVPDGVSQVKVVHRDGSQLAVARREREWEVISHRDIAADRQKVEAWVEAAGWIQAERFVIYDQEGLARYGLDKPLLSLSVTPRGKVPSLIQVGKALKEKTPEGEKTRYYATSGAVPAVFLLSEETVDSINKQIEDIIEMR
jgi:hypothetical protein